MKIIHETGISSSTAADWTSFCGEVSFQFFSTLLYISPLPAYAHILQVAIEKMMMKSGKIKGKIVKVDESKFQRTKYNRRHPAKDQWVYIEEWRE